MYNTEVMLLIENCYTLIESIKCYSNSGYTNLHLKESYTFKINNYKSLINSNSLLIKSDKDRLVNDLNKAILLF